MPRYSGAQPGAMVTDRDQHRPTGTLIAIVAAVVVLGLLTAYTLWV
jgi:hypothetical protein